MRIVVLDGQVLNPGDNPWDDVAKLGEFTVHDRTPDDLTVERARDAEIIVTNKSPLAAATIGRLPKLRFITILATGHDVVDAEAARRRGIPVSNVPDYATDSVAQFVFALLLELCHHVGEHDRAVKDGEWSRAADFCFWKTPLVELCGKRMGIVGFGRIGRRVGELAHAFGMDVLASRGRRSEEPGYEPFGWRTVAEIFAESDVVTLHCPQTTGNTGMVNAGLLGMMKPGAFLINTARGGLVAEQDLADALNAGRIAGAAADVAASEPVPAGSPLLSARNCILTPHIAWAALAARRRLMEQTARNIAAFIAGNPVNVVN